MVWGEDSEENKKIFLGSEYGLYLDEIQDVEGKMSSEMKKRLRGFDLGWCYISYVFRYGLVSGSVKSLQTRWIREYIRMWRSSTCEWKVSGAGLAR